MAAVAPGLPTASELLPLAWGHGARMLLGLPCLAGLFAVLVCTTLACALACTLATAALLATGDFTNFLA